MLGNDEDDTSLPALQRRRLPVAGSSFLGFATIVGTAVRAAGSPGRTTHMLDVANGKPA